MFILTYLLLLAINSRSGALYAILFTWLGRCTRCILFTWLGKSILAMDVSSRTTFACHVTASH